VALTGYLQHFDIKKLAKSVGFSTCTAPFLSPFKVLVLAVSYDTQNAKYLQLLGKVAKRKFSAESRYLRDDVRTTAVPTSRATTGDAEERRGRKGTDDGYEYTTDYMQQGRWTGCNESEREPKPPLHPKRSFCRL